MIPSQLIKEAENFLEDSVGVYKRPPLALFRLATSKGQELAEKLGARKDIVEAGTLFMDCLLPRAIAEGRVTEHVLMSWEKSCEIIDKYPQVCSKREHTSLRFGASWCQQLLFLRVRGVLQRRLL